MTELEETEGAAASEGAAEPEKYIRTAIPAEEKRWR